MAKKISAIVSLSIIGILIIATIIMANVKINYNVKCATPDAIYVCKNGGTKQDIVDQNKKNTVIEYINNASKEITLTALFNGNINKKAVLVKNKGTLDLTEIEFAVFYVYNNAQQLKDGKELYKDVNGQAVTYQHLIFAIPDYHKGETQYKVYVGHDETDRTAYNYYYELSADFSSLFGYLTDNYVA